VIGSDPGVRFVGVLRIKERVVGAAAGGPWLGVGSGAGRWRTVDVGPWRGLAVGG
jgi:hypothetical protein